MIDKLETKFSLCQLYVKLFILKYLKLILLISKSFVSLRSIYAIKDIQIEEKFTKDNI